MSSRQTHHNKLINRKAVREALKRWHNTTKLGSLPLTHLTFVTRQIIGEDTTVTRGMALRDSLRQAIDALRPNMNEPVITDVRWRAYTILHLQFIEGLTPYVVAEHLFLARSTYNHLQAQALDLLVAKLNEFEESAMTHEQVKTTALIVPFLAPPTPPHQIIGRDVILAHLKEHLLWYHNQTFFALNGLPGVGKTALAIAVAHDPDVIRHFGDGILWGRLGPHANVLAILGQWAVALGVEPARISNVRSIVQRAELVHAAIGLRRMLLIIDDAWSTEDALAFRVGGPNCAHLITTRLPHVAVQFAGNNITVIPELNEEEGLWLLSNLAPAAASVDNALARELVRLTGGLPLALLLIGNHLQIESYLEPIATLKNTMQALQSADTRGQLSQLQGPLDRHPSLPLGQSISLSAIIAISESHLKQGSRLLLQALTVFPPKPNSFSKPAALTVAQQEEVALSELIRSGLLEQNGLDRYSLHQSIREFVQQQLTDDTVYLRMVAYFTTFLETHVEHYEVVDEDMMNITAAMDAASQHQIGPLFLRLALVFYPFLETRGLYGAAKTYLAQAKITACALPDLPSLVKITGHLGQVALDYGNYNEAQVHYQEGLVLARKLGLPEEISRLLQGLAIIADHRGAHEEAESLYLESLALARSTDSRRRISNLLMNLGGLAYDRGSYSQAEMYLSEGLALAKETSYRENMSPILLNLGAVAASRGDYDQEEAYYLEGLAVARGIDHRENVCFLLGNLGAVARDRGNYTEAQEYLEEGLAIARQIGHQERICGLLRNLGELNLLLKELSKAEAHFEEGLAIARKLAHRKNETALLGDLGELAHLNGDHKAAEQYLSEALVIAREIESQWYISDTLIKWGHSLLKQRSLVSAHEKFQEALTYADNMADQGLIARAKFGLSQAERGMGNLQAAHQHAEDSFAIFQAMGDKQAEEVQEWLKTLV